MCNYDTDSEFPEHHTGEVEDPYYYKLLSNRGSSYKAEYQSSTYGYSDSMPSELDKGIYHLVILTKDVNFKAAEKNAMLGHMYKEVFVGIQITDMNICAGMESWIIVEDDTIFHDALFYAILYGGDKVDNYTATVVNGVNVVTAEVVKITFPVNNK